MDVADRRISVRVADLRLVLPQPVESAVVVDDPAWSAALAAAGVDVSPSSAPDLCVAPSIKAALEAAPGARQLVVARAGRGRWRLRRKGFRSARVLSWGPRGAPPRAVVRTDHRTALRHALDDVLTSAQWWRRARNRMLGRVLPFLPLPGRTWRVAWKGQWTPFPLRAVPGGEVPSEREWCLVLGSGDELQRAVLLSFDQGRPVLATKVARVRGDAGADAMRRDEQALARLAGLAPVAARHAPAVLARTSVAGHSVSVETAARGRPLNHVLTARRGHGSNVALIDAVAEWAIGLAEESAGREWITPELERLATVVIPRWSDLGVTPSLLDGLDEVPAVLQHNDLGSWNILATGRDFTVVDWESSSAGGLPLWDLLYFLTDSLVLLDGPRPVARRLEATRRLLRGEHDQSPRLFRWVDLARVRLGLREEVVGPIATLGWLHHGLSHQRRTATLRTAAGRDRPSDDVPSLLGTIPRLAPLWFDDPLLGRDWPARQAR